MRHTESFWKRTNINTVCISLLSLYIFHHKLLTKLQRSVWYTKSCRAQWKMVTRRGKSPQQYSKDEGCGKFLSESGTVLRFKVTLFRFRTDCKQWHSIHFCDISVYMTCDNEYFGVQNAKVVQPWYRFRRSPVYRRRRQYPGVAA